MRGPRDVMMRFVLITALSLAMGGNAMAQTASTSPVGMEVRGDDGTLMGRVTGVSRDENGRLVGVSIAGLEPAAAPRAQRPREAPRPALIARNERRSEARMIRRDGSLQLADNR